VVVRVSSLGSAISLASELKWYIARYMQDVLFEVNGDIYCTWSLARQVSERDVRLLAPWEIRILYGFRGGQVSGTVLMEPDTTQEPYLAQLGETEKILEVWATPEDLEGR
jgi:hypothetical protein